MKHVLVVGDTIIDEYVYGKVNRISPEAPVPILDINSADSGKVFLGGACNVAVNIRRLTEGLDVEVHYVGAVSELIADMLSIADVATPEVNCKDSEILHKLRFLDGSHHLIRIDSGQQYSQSVRDSIFGVIKNLQAKYDLVVFSDYDKGTINSKLVSEISLKAACPILADIKKYKNFATGFKHSEVILKCNEREFLQELHERELMMPVVVTKGDAGCVVVYPLEDPVEIQGIFVGSLKDVVGAGDTFLAGMAANYLEFNLFSPSMLARYGNRCAAAKVTHVGTYAPSRSEMVKREF